MEQRKIYIGADHRGFPLKEKLKGWMENNYIAYEDLGNLTQDPDDDYPDYADKVARRVIKDNTFGILLCGSAQGVCVAANKVKGIRAVTPSNIKEARLAREHLDANVICIAQMFIHFHLAKQMIKTFLTTPFSEEPRHVRRLNKIYKIESAK